MRRWITLFLILGSASTASGSDSEVPPPWNPQASSEARCHIFDDEAEPALAWFSEHPESLDKWIRGLQNLCFTDHHAQSDFRRAFLREFYEENRATILDQLQPYQQHPRYGITASRIVDAVHALDMPYR
jgi:hypothetical protein